MLKHFINYEYIQPEDLASARQYDDIDLSNHVGVEARYVRTGSAEKAYTLNLGTSTFDYVKVFALSGDYLPLCVSVQKTAS